MDRETFREGGVNRYEGQEKRNPIILDDDYPDPSDLDAARLAREDDEYRRVHAAANRAAHNLAREVLNNRAAFRTTVEEKVGFGALHDSDMAMERLADEYERAMRGVVSGPTGGEG